MYVCMKADLNLPWKRGYITQLKQGVIRNITDSL